MITPNLRGLPTMMLPQAPTSRGKQVRELAARLQAGAQPALKEGKP